MHEVFATGKSFLHRADPRLKMVSCLTWAVVVAVLDYLPALIMAAGMALVMAALARLQPGALIKRLMAVNAFFAFMWVFVLFSKGRPLFEIGPLTASYEGLYLSLSITLKGNAIILAALALMATSPVFALFHGMQHLRMPTKLVQLFFFVYRYVHEISAEYRRLRQAMTARGFRAGTNRRTYRALANLIGALILRSTERADRVYASMLSRGFHGQFYALHHPHYHASDFVLAGLIHTAAAGLVVLSLTRLI